MENVESKIERILKECFRDGQKAVSNYTKKLVSKKTIFYYFGGLKAKCPTCDMPLPYTEYDYCPYCGQHLDWSECLAKFDE